MGEILGPRPQNFRAEMAVRLTVISVMEIQSKEGLSILFKLHHSTRLIAKYRLYIDLRLAALDNIFARQKGLPPGHAISSS